MPTVNPEILVWARQTAGLTLQDATAKVGIRDAYGVKAVDRLAALERGDEEPTRPTLLKMARQYHRPLLAFCLTAPPRPDRGASVFRTPPGTRSPETRARVATLVRNLRSRQSMVRAALEAEDEAERLPFVGALVRREEGGAAIESVGHALRSEVDTGRLSRRAATLLGQVLGDDLSARRYYAQRTAADGFLLLRSRTERAGVFVVLKGDLGSHHTALEAEVFRGLAIADDVAPFVVINPNDSRAAWSFTLLHELTHLLSGQSGYAVGNRDSRIERFCDAIASEWLLPASELSLFDLAPGATLMEAQGRITRFAGARNLSRAMVAYRLLRSRRMDRVTFNRLRVGFREQWRQSRDRQRARGRNTEGGPIYYVVRRHRVGPSLLDFTRRMLNSGALSTTKAARLLGVKPAHVGKMLRSESGRST